MLDDDRSAAQLLNNIRKLFLIKRFTCNDCYFTLFQTSLFLNCFYNINRKDCLTRSFSTNHKKVTCLGCSFSLCPSIVIQYFNDLFAHSSHRYKIWEQLLLFFCKSGFQTYLTRSTQIISSGYNKSCIERNTAFRFLDSCLNLFLRWLFDF